MGANEICLALGIVLWLIGFFIRNKTPQHGMIKILFFALSSGIFVANTIYILMD